MCFFVGFYFQLFIIAPLYNNSISLVLSENGELEAKGVISSVALTKGFDIQDTKWLVTGGIDNNLVVTVGDLISSLVAGCNSSVLRYQEFWHNVEVVLSFFEGVESALVVWSLECNVHNGFSFCLLIECTEDNLGKIETVRGPSVGVTVVPVKDGSLVHELCLLDLVVDTTEVYAEYLFSFSGNVGKFYPVVVEALCTMVELGLAILVVVKVVFFSLLDFCLVAVSNVAGGTVYTEKTADFSEDSLFSVEAGDFKGVGSMGGAVGLDCIRMFLFLHSEFIHCILFFLSLCVVLTFNFHSLSAKGVYTVKGVNTFLVSRVSVVKSILNSILQVGLFLGHFINDLHYNSVNLGKCLSLVLHMFVV